MALRIFVIPSSARPMVSMSFQLLSRAGHRSYHADRLLPIFSLNSQTTLLSQFSSMAVRNMSCLSHTQCQACVSQRIQREIHVHTSPFNNTWNYRSLSVLPNQCKTLVKNEGCLYISNKSVSTQTKTEKIAPVSNVGQKKLRRNAIREKEPPYIYVRDKTHFINMTTYPVGVETDLIRLREALVAQNVYQIVKLPKDFTEVIMAKAKYLPNGKTREVFFFADGAVSCWNMQETEVLMILRFVKHYTEQPYNLKLVKRESEMFPVILDKETMLTGKTVYLKELSADTGTAGTTDGSPDATPERDLKLEGDLKQLQLEKFAFSNAVVQSVKLAVWESMLEEFKEDMEPTQKSNNGHLLSIGRNELHQKLREILQLRYDINLGSDLLDSPDVYWEREDLDHHYKNMCSHLDLSKRTKVMNDKLNYCTESLELFSSRLNDDRHVRLELFIIILIMIEVVFEIFHFAERVVTDHYKAPPPTPSPANHTNNAVTFDQWKQLLDLTAQSCDDTTNRGREILKQFLVGKQAPAARTQESSFRPNAAVVSNDEN